MGKNLGGRTRTHRSVGQWMLCIFLAVVAVMLPTLAIRDALGHAELLRHRGITVMADVVATRAKSCEVIFVDRSHGTAQVQQERLYAYFHVGRKIEVVYDPQNPSTIATADSIGVVREYLYRAPLMLIALAAGCGAVAVFLRSRPKRRPKESMG